MNKQQKIFLTYTHADIDKVDVIVKKCIDNNINIYHGFQNNIPISIHELQYDIETGDTLLYFISNGNGNSERFLNDITSLFEIFRKRKIQIIPIILEKVSIHSDLLDFEIVNLSKHFDKNLNKLIEKLKLIPEISFDNFTSEKFENLVYDLLQEYKFKSITKSKNGIDFGFDFKAEFNAITPFGNNNLEYWLIECKFYKDERFSINNIEKIIYSWKKNLQNESKLLLITNSILTSIAQQHISNIRINERISIEVIDGIHLKQLILKRKSLVRKYF